jgi:hypothetical protein
MYKILTIIFILIVSTYANTLELFATKVDSNQTHIKSYDSVVLYKDKEFKSDLLIYDIKK